MRTEDKIPTVLPEQEFSIFGAWIKLEQFSEQGRRPSAPQERRADHIFCGTEAWSMNKNSKGIEVT